MTCIIIEDQPPAQRILKKYIGDVGYLQLKGTFSDAVRALGFLQENPVDLIFLDIHLPKISGMDFLKTLPRVPHVILTTAFSEYALEGYEFNVVDYLLKPFSFERFMKALAKIPQASRHPNATPQQLSQELFIKSGHDWLKIRIAEIAYIRADADYTELVLPTQKHLSPESLNHWASQLKPHQFARIHKSYIVNTAKIERISGNQVYLDKSLSIPIGRAYKEGFLEQFLKK